VSQKFTAAEIWLQWPYSEKKIEINTNFTAVSNVLYRILNEITQSKCNSILGKGI